MNYRVLASDGSTHLVLQEPDSLKMDEVWLRNFGFMVSPEVVAQTDRLVADMCEIRFHPFRALVQLPQYRWRLFKGLANKYLRYPVVSRFGCRCFQNHQQPWMMT